MHAFQWVIVVVVCAPLLWFLASRWLALALGSCLAVPLGVAASARPIAIDDRRLVLDSRKWDFDHRESHDWRIKIAGKDQLVL